MIIVLNKSSQNGYIEDYKDNTKYTTGTRVVFNKRHTKTKYAVYTFTIPKTIVKLAFTPRFKGIKMILHIFSSFESLNEDINTTTLQCRNSLILLKFS